MKESTSIALAIGGAALLALLALAGTAKASPAPTVRIEPHCRYRWVWVVRPPLNAAQLEGFTTAANNAPDVRNVEVQSSAEETRATLEILSGPTPAHDARPGVDSMSMGGLVMTLATVTRIDCE